MKEITRSIENALKADLQKKIVILAGPRQCGKTTLSKSILKNYEYLNYDIIEDRTQILNREWNRQKDLIIFDEIHKMPKWKSWLKGIYDKEGITPPILVTGSARLDAFKKTGDSLAGRHLYYRLHPFDLKEISSKNIYKTPEAALKKMFEVGGYPEPFLTGDISFYKKWRRGHLDLILKQDLIDFQTVRDIQSIQILVELLRSKVGSGISVNALATDLGKDPKTVQKWLNIIEDLFIVFKVSPYSKDISRSLKKEPKYYFYDTGLVDGDESIKLENIVACSLLKEVHKLMDCDGIEYQLNYLKVKGGKEIDFLVLPKEKGLRPIMIEVKLGQADASPNFKVFESSLKKPVKIQLVQNLKRTFQTAEGIEVTQCSDWLSDFDFLKYK